MYLPHIKNLEKSTRRTVNVFGGYNHTPVIGENEFYNMTNMTSDMYPVLSVRRQRRNTLGGIFKTTDVFMGGGVKAYLMSDPYVYLNGTIDSYNLGIQSDARHSMVMMGAYLVIFPEGVYINTMDTEERGSLAEKRYMDGPTGPEPAGHGVSIRLCDEDGNARSVTSKSGLPETYHRAEGDKDYLYFPRVGLIYRWDEENQKLLEEGDSYIKIENDAAVPVGDIKAQYELMRAWCKDIQPNDYVELGGFTGDAEFINGKHVVKNVCPSVDYGSGWIVVKGYVDGIISAPLSALDRDATPYISHVIPPLDYVISCNNRLWGCRYGEAHNGEFVNEIYATAEGDIRRWLYLADDSASDNAWAASIGHAGPFTGAVCYAGKPYFFKNDRIYAVYGSDATTFGYSEIPERGVQAGCDRSLCVLDGILYYKAQDGIVAFDGSSTRLISDALGAVRYKNAVGGGVDGKYYVSMTDVATEKPSLFVYDARRGLWHREDGFAPVRIASDVSGRLWGLSGDGSLTFLGGDDTNVNGRAEGLVPWMAETGIWGLDDPDKKYVSRISLRLSLDVGAYIKVSIQYDSVGSFEQVLFYEGVNLQTVTLPIIPRRCDHMRLRLEGEGNVRIYALTRTVESVGE